MGMREHCAGAHIIRVFVPHSRSAGLGCALSLADHESANVPIRTNTRMGMREHCAGAHIIRVFVPHSRSAGLGCALSLADHKSANVPSATFARVVGCTYDVVGLPSPLFCKSLVALLQTLYILSWAVLYKKA